MICLAVTFLVRAGAEDRAADCFRKLTDLTRTEPGCRLYQFHRSTSDPRKFFVYEQYDDEQALEAHSASAYFAHYVRGELPPLVEGSEFEKYEPI